jgi:PAS domain-containing protein
LSQSATLSVDTLGRILTWSEDAEELLGYSQCEAVGQSLLMIIPEHLRRRHNTGYRLASALERCRYCYGELPLQGLARLGLRLKWPFCPRVRHTRGRADRIDVIFAVFCKDDVDRQFELKDDGACGGILCLLGWQAGPPNAP